MPIVQISRIQHRRGLKTDLPQLAAGELGWVVDEQRLYIGNGTVADGAPAVGNTEIMTSGTGTFTAALSVVYQGYLGHSTPIVTGASGDITRTLQERLDDYVSVKSFGAKGDDSTADVGAIQRAIDELYRDTDKDDTRARRILYFPAGTYRINTSLTIPPFAHLVGDGPDKTIIRNSGNNAVAVTEDDEGGTFGTIGSSSATTPNQIQIEGITFKNTVAYGGVSIDNATNVYFNNCKFHGTYATTTNSDTSTSKGVTVRATTALPCKNITFNQCQFTGFCRLVDLSYDVLNTKFINCDFSIGYYGALIGAEMDGSTSGLVNGPRDVQFVSSSWSQISQQAILVAPATGANAGTGPRNILSSHNFYASTVGNNHEGVGSILEVPVIQYDNDECGSIQDFFERSDLRRDDGSSELNIAPEVQGIARYSNRIKQITLEDNKSAATTTTLEFAGGSGNLGKSIVLNYKIERASTVRVGTFTISMSTNGITHNDDFQESNGDAGVTLTAVIGREDSTSLDKSVIVKYATTSTGSDATMDVESTTIV